MMNRNSIVLALSARLSVDALMTEDGNLETTTNPMFKHAAAVQQGSPPASGGLRPPQPPPDSRPSSSSLPALPSFLRSKRLSAGSSSSASDEQWKQVTYEEVPAPGNNVFDIFIPKPSADVMIKAPRRTSMSTNSMPKQVKELDSVIDFGADKNTLKTEFSKFVQTNKPMKEVAAQFKNAKITHVFWMDCGKLRVAEEKTEQGTKFCNVKEYDMKDAVKQFGDVVDVKAAIKWMNKTADEVEPVQEWDEEKDLKQLIDVIIKKYFIAPKDTFVLRVNTAEDFKVCKVVVPEVSRSKRSSSCGSVKIGDVQQSISRKKSNRLLRDAPNLSEWEVAIPHRAAKQILDKSKDSAVSGSKAFKVGKHAVSVTDDFLSTYVASDWTLDKPKVKEASVTSVSVGDKSFTDGDIVTCMNNAFAESIRSETPVVFDLVLVK